MEKDHFPLSQQQQQEHRRLMFGSPSIGVNQQLIRVETHSSLNDIGTQYYLIQDSMTIKQLRQRWYQNRLQQNPQFYSEQFNNTKQNYSFIWNHSLALFDHITFEEIKQAQDIQKIKENTIQIYFNAECPISHDQGSVVNIEVLQNKHKLEVDLTFKYIPINHPQKIKDKNTQKSVYFYVKIKTMSTIKTIKSELDTFFKKQSLFKKSQLKNKKYHIAINKDMIKPNSSKKVNMEINHALKTNKFKQNQIYLNQQLTLINIGLFQNFILRQIYPSNQPILLQFQQGDTLNYLLPKLKSDPIFKIICFQRDIKQGINQSLIKIKGEQLKLRIIKVKYSQIYSYMVKTFFIQNQIQDPFFTSLCVQNKQLLRPIEKFSQIETFINSIKKDQIQIFSIPQNFLFYRELITYKKTMKDVLTQIQKLQKQTSLTKSNIKSVNIKRDDRIKQIKQGQFKNQNFIDPIMLYTSPYIYQKLNQFLRETSISQFQKQKSLKQFWHYSFCQKLISNLLKLKNHSGKVYRGTVNVDYNYTQAQIIQWNSFTSTSSNQQQALKFLQYNLFLPYMFEIQTYSGKMIGEYSYFESQHEVLIMPYTKFVISKIQYRLIPKFHDKVKIKYIYLTQLPVPKRISGKTIVWIDQNLQNNAKVYHRIAQKYNLKDFDLIQLQTNESFKLWLNQYKNLFSLPDAKVLFISNMNRSKKSQKQGIQTLRMVRNVRKENKFVFFIGQIKQKLNDIKQAGYENDKNILVIEKGEQLSDILRKFNQNVL